MAVFATKKLTGLDARVGPVTATDTFIATDAAGVAGMGYGTTGAQIASFLGSIYQPLDSDLTALAANTNNGLWARTGAGTGAARTLTAPAAGITISNPAGIAGDPTFALANDLAALEGMAGTGLVARTAADTYAQRTITGTANQILVTNGGGIAGNPTLALDMTALDARYIDTVDTAVQAMAGPLQLPQGISTSGLRFGATGPLISSDIDANLRFFAGGSERFTLYGATAAFGGLATAGVPIGAVTPRLLQAGNSNSGSSYFLIRANSGGASPTFYIGATRNADPLLRTAGLSGDALGVAAYVLDDGTDLVVGADIAAFLEANASPTVRSTRFAFRTRTGAGSVTERIGISSVGDLSIGGAANIVIDAARSFYLRAYTVATLPTVGTPGRLVYVTDALAPTYRGIVAGGGAVRTLVFDNGTNWVS